MATIISFPRRSNSLPVGSEGGKPQFPGEPDLSPLLSTLEADLVLLRAGLVELNRQINMPRVAKGE